MVAGSAIGGGAAATATPAAVSGAALQLLLETRVCGSLSTNNYADVKPECLTNSPAAQFYKVVPF